MERQLACDIHCRYLMPRRLLSELSVLRRHWCCHCCCHCRCAACALLASKQPAWRCCCRGDQHDSGMVEYFLTENLLGEDPMRVGVSQWWHAGCNSQVLPCCRDLHLTLNSCSPRCHSRPLQPDLAAAQQSAWQCGDAGGQAALRDLTCAAASRPLPAQLLVEEHAAACSHPTLFAAAPLRRALCRRCCRRCPS